MNTILAQLARSTALGLTRAGSANALGMLVAPGNTKE